MPASSSLRRSTSQLISKAHPSPTLTSTRSSSPVVLKSSFTPHPHQSYGQHRLFATSNSKMSAMEATQGHSKPCCNVLPVVSSGYKAKGSYEEIGGYKTYVTGPKDATKAIVVIYDIFGYFDQTLQGADILAHSDESQKFQVFMPDWFKGEPCPIEIFPPDTDEKKKQLGEFFGKFPPPDIAGKVPDYVKAVKGSNSSLSKFAILGYCWGGKVANLSAAADTNPFSVVASAHPAMVDPADADKLTIPTILLASGDEDKDDVKKFEDRLKVTKHVETFGDQIHGWMAARSNLSDDNVKKEYKRGYQTLLEFFCKNL